MAKLRVAIIIPAYNEAKVISGVIGGALQTINTNNYQVEVVLVNDHSLDDTAKVAKASGAIVINHLLNSGAGAATATGLDFAKREGFDIAATMDADGQHLSTDVLKGIGILVKNDMDLLVGSRLINSEGMSKTKEIGNKGLSIITNLIFGIQSTDSQSGLRIFSRRAIEKLHWESSGFEFCSEMLWRARQLGLRVSEYPIKAVYTDYSKSKGQNNWNAFNIIKALIRRRVLEFWR